MTFREATACIRVLPDFLIIGTQKGGTTSLYHYLEQHPDVCMSTVKEPHFLERPHLFSKGIRYYKSFFPTVIQKKYRELVLRENFVAGEATSGYLFVPDAPEKAAAALPNAKIIVLLRNPCLRAFSHYKMSVKHGLESKSFMDALLEEKFQLENEPKNKPYEWNMKSFSFSYLKRGIYWQQLAQWYAHYPKEQFLIIKSEDFFEDPKTSLQQIFQFLQVPEIFPADLSPFNQGEDARKISKPEMDFLQTFFKDHNQRLYDTIGVNYDW